jgi:putative tryptophan/tyrosine transport system substrate-binding protein
MKRRDFVTLLGGATVAWPLAARAQQPDRVRRVGVLVGAENDPATQARVAAFRQGLAALGWIEGRNVHVDYRFGGNADRLGASVADLVGVAPDVIVSSPQGLGPLRQATRTIPIVFVLLADPIGQGFVASLARPGGMMTGFASLDPSTVSKQLQLLKQVAPRVTRVANLYDPLNPTFAAFADMLVATAPTFNIEAWGAPVRNAAEIGQSIEALARESNGALMVAGVPENLDLILRLAARHRLPTMGPLRFLPARGGLMSYGFDDLDEFRSAASYVDRILKGAKPGELPVQYPTKYQLIINLKTAKELSLDISPALLSVADELIE